MSSPARLLIVEENGLFRQCLASALASAGVFEVVGQAGARDDAIALATQLRPDVLLVDAGLPGRAAVTLTDRVSREVPEARVIILALAEAEAEVLACVQAGAQAFVLKEASFDELTETIHRVRRGETVCPPPLAPLLFARLSALAREHSPAPGLEPAGLTAREAEIVRLIGEGLGNKQIAKALRLSLHTVKNHVHHILEKLQVSDHQEAVQYVYRQRWLQRR
jgi:DNA-binding NarL/FixJ family response regulator